MEEEMSKCKQMCSVRIGLPGQEDESAHKSKGQPAASAPLIGHNGLPSAAISIAGVVIGWAARIKAG